MIKQESIKLFCLIIGAWQSGYCRLQSCQTCCGCRHKKYTGALQCSAIPLTFTLDNTVTGEQMIFLITKKKRFLKKSFREILLVLSKNVNCSLDVSILGQFGQNVKRWRG